MNNNNHHQEALDTLIAMGFPSDQAATALRESGGNLENAANWLLSSSSSEVTTTATAATMMITCPLHQYNIDHGKSACTCIALVAAQSFLQQQVDASALPLHADFLQSSIVQGVEMYNQIMASSSHAAAAAVGGVEHLSAEEVLQQDLLPHLQLDGAGGVVQGILSDNHDDAADLSLRALVSASQAENHWTCALITKPPETVLCCLPPARCNNNNSNSYNNELPFLLIDSHPRAHLWGADGSYIRSHNSVSALCQSLERLFPPLTSLGPDVPEIMVAMYNQFDLYRFSWKD